MRCPIERSSFLEMFCILCICVRGADPAPDPDPVGSREIWLDPDPDPLEKSPDPDPTTNFCYMFFLVSSFVASGSWASAARPAPLDL